MRRGKVVAFCVGVCCGGVDVTHGDLADVVGARLVSRRNKRVPLKRCDLPDSRRGFLGGPALGGGDLGVY